MCSSGGGVIDGDRPGGGVGDGGGDGGGPDRGEGKIGDGARKAATIKAASPTDWLVQSHGVVGSHSARAFHHLGASWVGGKVSSIDGLSAAEEPGSN